MPNERARVLSALVFLDINGISIDREDDRLYELTLAAAEGRLDKRMIAEQLKTIAGTDENR